MTLPVAEEVDDRERDLFVATGGLQLGPGAAVHEAVLALHGGVHASEGARVRQHGGDGGQGMVLLHSRE
jgi:hypothetical protein